MQRLDEDSIRRGPVFSVNVEDQYSARAAKPLFEKLIPMVPEARIFGINHGFSGSDEQVRGWLGESERYVALVRDMAYVPKTEGMRFNLIIPFDFIHGMRAGEDFKIEQKPGVTHIFINPERLKYDVETPVSEGSKTELRRLMGLGDGKFVVAAGSIDAEKTNNPAGVCIDDWAKIHRQISNTAGVELVSVIAARTPITDWASMFSSFKDTRVLRLSHLRKGVEKPPEEGGYAVIVDTYGELPEIYSVSNLAYVNANHNIIEPMTQGVAPIFRPENISFPQTIPEIIRRGVGVGVRSNVELADAIWELAKHPERATEMGESALAFKKEQGGISRRLAEKIRELLDGGKDRGKRRRPDTN